MKTITVEIDKEQAKLIEESIKSMSGKSLYDSGHSEEDFKHSVKKKVVLTEDEEYMIENLNEGFIEFLTDTIYEIREEEGDGDRSIEMLKIKYKVNVDSLTKKGKRFYVDLMYEYELELEEFDYDD